MSGDDLLTTTTLRERAADAVADEHLQGALARFTDALRLKREEAQETLDNYQELRDAARAIRHRVISRLPEVLDRLADRVEAAGGHVFFAQTAEEATGYITRLARARGAELVVKSKSMASEEIHVNDALGSLGIETVETDLGEWIIQLAGETPSHILAPAIHKTRGNVADLFNRIAGGDLSDVPEELTAFARAQLREKFLTADLGISGVNFGVAETGTLTVVTNEGNGRLVTSVPPVHVAIMGMERVVETFADLDVLLALLTRAATGQEISSYVNLVTGPRREGEVDGPDELHLIVLDNGRSEVLGSEFQEILHCIRCGSCLNVCPVYRQIGGHAYGWVYSGPIGAVLTPLLHQAEHAGELANASSLCGACHHACPVGIPLQDLLLAQRRRNAAQAPITERAAWKAWAETWRHPSAYRASVRGGSLAARMLPEALAPSRWTGGRTPPRPAQRTDFRTLWRQGRV